jgi:hypothetical protein
MKPKRKTGRSPRKPGARLPLPRKTEKRHGDARKFDRSREKRRVRRELERE